MNEKPKHEVLEPDWQHLKRYGYAPGGYLARCRCCGEMVEFVDKRATCCLPCATQQYAAEIGRQMQSAEGAREG